ncbi:MAG: GNAT family N-acetyltransferase [Phycisphaerae bacterium]|nr:GNAT family N-acetyltransferase [Phycisphaerae bacterium]NIW96204.1 GNAT family N-acetyltransferase [Phycisphaerae bacterium]NIX59799.1 GNAT family N-acetyltransferase [candidate division Zixibacteria bacterium]
MTIGSVDFSIVPSSDVEDLRNEWGEKAYRHFHIDDGFMINAISEGRSIGLISSYWRKLPEPLEETKELYIDFLEVHPDYRRQGIARKLIELTVDQTMQENAYQVRSWSSEDKREAIPMWKRLGFGLCQATTFPDGKEVKGFFVVKRLG